ncbi:Multidrug resistance protein MdtN [Pseudovibrio sp. W64]|uniref:HlyD family secretion protein n=2 Tax=Pseudovibrio TaxID=258255 RepID=UPI0007AE49B1|nr:MULTISPECIES: HlyD family secretion protein [unclassified Pseudovibrio]KZK80731.1 Multidrug resistance protein MdtN [Pseudovibrio sp. Ad13]KZK86679.1 Multidrug resistance protein MdtN [Pseudovibrio sp. W64]KZL25260.1 Multidrug resistance protein MdtN [Pseudovibrio sp. WM33]
MRALKPIHKAMITGTIVGVAVLAFAYKYYAYLQNPWTRDGQVRANVIQIATRVSGPIVDLPIKDNQSVQAGQLLFRIDPRTFEATFAEKKADLDQTIDQLNALGKEREASEANVAQYRSNVEQASSELRSSIATLKNIKGNLDRNAKLLKDGYVTQRTYDQIEKSYIVALSDTEKAQSGLAQAEAALVEAQASLAKVIATLGATGDENAQLRSAKAALRMAELDLGFSRVSAPVSGYVTNLNLRLGSQTVENEPALALVDITSFWIDAYFPETKISRINIGDKVIMTLMAYPDQVVHGEVESIGWGISQSDGSTGSDLLPNINPTFEWIRLAQRIPVRVKIADIPKDILLRVGTTVSVLVLTNTAADKSTPDEPPAPLLFQ